MPLMPHGFIAIRTNRALFTNNSFLKVKEGGVAMANSQRNRRSQTKPQRHVSARGVRRDQADLRKLSRALIRLALESAADEAAAELQHKAAQDEGSQSNA